ncbi:GNAT family N-acetyltransferase [Calidifontibacter sp. DB0510]|uniref:GNAT family N-acetyltransferase n=1 Tax=Metallococcus carri TaxID=1656884 RepID=A0A967B4Y6_9MICO|nr:GNAT family N-acetyltransferase [Metallococcus carri]NHN54716.1 GNAT family N-acetyltransferase [Metallococcus carri]NOP37061.1 GNAT family N-acetyltransferase [Calidifontibacter sp. DB2511S]
MRITVVDAVGSADTAELWPVYDAVFGDQPDESTWRKSVWDKHIARSGFALARAYDDSALVGFAYGYTGEAGQWWTDNVRSTLPAAVAEEWLGDHFELVSIGVLASHRSHGIGRALMRALLADRPEPRWLLQTTADADDPARRLYAAEGWRVLGPGTGEGTVVMGRQR